MSDPVPGGDDAVDARCWRAHVALNRHDNCCGTRSLFDAAGRELYLVGGSVRDAVLGRLSTDLDFTTDARPDEVQKIVRPWADALWDTGIEFGTVGATRRDQRVEITTFRADTYDRVSRNPTVRFGDRLEDDLVRRDFTANAMAVRITAAGPGEFLDPLGGLAALRDGVLDTPSPPQVSFGDDPLRMLRAARFVSQLGFTVAPRVRLSPCRRWPSSSTASRPSGRGRARQAAAGSRPRRRYRPDRADRHRRAGAARDGAMRMAIDEHHQHKDVYQHSLTVLRQAIELEETWTRSGVAVGGAAA